ncbi:MAG TPA: WD40 repeat domain-containing protein [Trebonia sp.]|nr:WD40 repeat domain-containing protein [Trebonia sp.]
MSVSVVPGQVVGAHRDRVNGAAFSPDGDQFVAGDQAGGLAVYRRAGGLFEAAASIRVPPYSANSRPRVTAVAWSPDGEHIAVSEGGSLRLRRPAGLAELASAFGGLRAIGIGGGGRWLAELGQSGVSVAELPSLRHLASHHVYRGDFEYFRADALGVDPAGSLVAVADNGGQDETAMGLIENQGAPQVTLIDVHNGARVAIEAGHFIYTLVFDQWRDRLLTATSIDIGTWTRDGQPLGRFAPYPPQPARNHHPRAVVVTPFAVITTPDVTAHSVELWHPETFAPLGRADGPDTAGYDWMAAAPDGRTLLTPEVSKGSGYGIRVWHVTNGTAPRPVRGTQHGA